MTLLSFSWYWWAATASAPCVATGEAWNSRWLMTQLTNGEHACVLLFVPVVDILNIPYDWVIRYVQNRHHWHEHCQFVFSVLDELYVSRHAWLRTHYKRRWSTETILMPLGRGRFVVVHPCSTLSDYCQLATTLNAEVQKIAKIDKNWGFFAARWRQNKPIKTKFGT